MARFRYLGEPSRPKVVVSYGPTTAIRVRAKDGTVRVLRPIAPATSFTIGADIGYDITETRELHQLRHDPRFAEI